MTDRNNFLPTTPEDVRARGWSQIDFVYVTGDAYVDHPSFGVSIISSPPIMIGISPYASLILLQ